ncbi:MAG TPA: nuclear transport factor 2 family protein [Blastocatellia bacterium]|nr:nuclear transport factor 2 family protein [Blastocatellia bacterium]
MSQAKTAGTDEEKIIALEQEIFAAISSRDAASLRRLLADDFVYRTATGDEFERAAFLHNIATLPMTILEVRGENLKAKVFGETAVLTGVQKARVRDEQGREIISAVAFTDVFIRQGGQWLMALAYGVELPATPA